MDIFIYFSAEHEHQIQKTPKFIPTIPQYFSLLPPCHLCEAIIYFLVLFLFAWYIYDYFLYFLLCFMIDLEKLFVQTLKINI